MAFADVDVDVADRRLGKLAPFGGVVWAFGQPGDAMTFQAAVQAGSSELGDAVAQASEDVVERQQGALPELHDHGFLDHGFLDHGKDRAVRRARPHWRVFGGGWHPPLGHRVAAQPVAFGQGAARLSMLGARLELAASFGRCREDRLPKRFLRFSRQGSVMISRDQQP